MPFNGAGVFQRVRNWVADAAGGIKIRADFHDSEDDGFAAGLSNCIARDGQSIVTQNIPWNSKRITGLQDPVNPQDAVTKQYADTKFTTVPPPVNPTDAASKAYVDDNYVALTGDTMTGALTVPSLTSGPINCGAVYSTGTSQFVDKCLVVGAGQPTFAVHNTTAHQSWGFWVDTTGPMLIGYTDGSGIPIGLAVTIDAGVNFRVYGWAQKPGGGPWDVPSDARIKTVHGDYPAGLDAVTALRPVRYTYKGNDIGADGQSISKNVEHREFVGLVAQEVETVMSEMVRKTDGRIDGVAVNDLRNLDTGPLIYALVNAIKELKVRVEALEAG